MMNPLLSISEAEFLADHRSMKDWYDLRNIYFQMDKLSSSLDALSGAGRSDAMLHEEMERRSERGPVLIEVWF